MTYNERSLLIRDAQQKLRAWGIPNLKGDDTYHHDHLLTLLGYDVWKVKEMALTDEELDKCKLIVGPHGYAIAKMLEARLYAA